ISLLLSSSDITYFYYFFFYASRHHQDLHSFPTRRSSDLGGPNLHGSVTGNVNLTVLLTSWPLPVTRGNTTDIPHASACGISVVLDRKSTRLNSSHGSISYAVFCLKKKNKKRQACHTRVHD